MLLRYVMIATIGFSLILYHCLSHQTVHACIDNLIPYYIDYMPCLYNNNELAVAISSMSSTRPFSSLEIDAVYKLGNDTLFSTTLCSL